MSLSVFSRPVLWRERRPGDRSVGWLELFYDLVFVAALIELGAGLGDDVTWAGFGRFAVLFALLWWAWTGTTFYNNRIDVDDVPHRLLTLVQMFAIGTVAILSHEAFGDGAAAFSLAYGTIRVSLVVMYLRARRHVPEADPVTVPYARWFGAGAAVWLLAAAVPSPWRFSLWAVALGLDLVRVFSPSIREVVVERLPPDREHMAERYALFTIIVLGESFIKTTGSLAEEGLTLDGLVMGGFALAVTAGLWWTYFDDVADSPVRGDLGMAAGVTWVYGHLPLTLGLTSTGVAVEKLATLDLTEAPPSYELLLITGSIALTLTSVAALDAVTRTRQVGVEPRERVIARLTAVAALGVVALIGSSWVAWALGLVVSIVVAAQIAAEVVLARRAHAHMTQRIGAQVDAAAADQLCEHLRELGSPQPRTRGCEECLETGGTWINLRLCATCGYVGCCDDSLGHATEHHEETGHPAIRSAEPDQDWAWCYVHEQSAELAAIG